MCSRMPVAIRRLLPVGWAKFLWWRRKIDGCRVFALGVKPKYQDLGIAGAFYVEHLNNADPDGIWWGEMGWILETNKAMNRAMEGNLTIRFRWSSAPRMMA